MSLAYDHSQVDAEEAAPAEVPMNAADLEVYKALLGFTRTQLPELSEYVESSAVYIVNEFKEIAAQTKLQGESLAEVMKTAQYIEVDSQTISYEKAIEILYLPLSEAIDKILQVSRLAMSMVMNISNAADNIVRVEEFIDEVKALTKQTNMLAMNTQIEAARAGEAGKSFRIIAQEVKNLSEHIKGLSNEMQGEIREVSVSVKKSNDLVEQLANYDMTDNLELKGRIDELVNAIMDQNQRLGALLNDSADHSRRTSSTIANLVMNIQFQDRSSQIIGDLVTLLDKTIEHLHGDNDLAGQINDPDRFEALIKELITHIRLSDVRNLALQHLKDDGLLAEDSELAKQYLSSALKSAFVSAEAAEVSTDDDDDIELF